MSVNGKPIIVMAVFAWLPTVVVAQTNDAQYLGDTIPVAMVPGFSHSVSVTMRNTGTTTWTKAGDYYLGAVGDSDPFAPGRIGLTDDDSVAPGQDHTFTFTMIAPGSGVYTTDWRMLREHVEWFGDTLTRQVSISYGPDPPGAPTITWPTPGMVLGSNRPDISVQGDPSDAYEIHIGSYNTPASNDGWDSGIVSLNPGPDPISAMSGVLNPQADYYVFARLRNTNGWGPWSAGSHYFHVSGELLNDPYLVAGGGLQWRHAMCHNPDRNEYLITWQNGYIIKYHRLDATGARIGGEMVIEDDLAGHHRSVVCYNSARKEYLIEYAGWAAQDEVRVLRVDAATGNPIGSPIPLYATGIVMALQVAYSPADNSYLATWEAYSEGTVYGRMLNTTAAPSGATFRISDAQYGYCRNESIAFNPARDEYLVTFQGVTVEPHAFDCFGQRLRASDGSPIGTNFVLSATADSEGPGGVAYDPDLDRYLVVYEGGSPSPWGQFVSASGTLLGPRFPIGTGSYAGLMSNVAWNPVTKEYLATWASCCTANNFGQRLSAAGGFIGEPFRTNGDAVGIGNWSPMAVANPASGEYLIYWFCSYSQIYVRRYQTYPLPPPDTQAPAPVTGLTLSRTPTAMELSWTNPPTPDFSATMLRVKAGSPPTGPTDGTLVVDQANAPATTDHFTDTSLTRGAVYCYAAFAHDLAPNYAAAATACGILVAGDFDGDDDVDQADFGHLQACLSGDQKTPPPGCDDADLDGDGDADLADFARFANCAGGTNLPPGC